MTELEIEYVDLSRYAGDEKEALTTEAMRNGVPLIYSARIAESGLLGDPDLLRKEAGGYVAGDIKSGSGEEGDEDNRRPKKHYGVQLALYTDILERKESRLGGGALSGTCMAKRSCMTSKIHMVRASRARSGRITKRRLPAPRRSSIKAVKQIPPIAAGSASFVTGILSVWSSSKTKAI